MENLVTMDEKSLALEKLGVAYGNLARAQRRLRGRDAMQPGRLTAPQVNLLQPLALEGPMPSGRLAEAAGLTAATTTHMLDQLAVAGVVERVRQDHDKRVVITSLTAEGERMFAARSEEMAAAWGRALEQYSTDQIDAAIEVFEAVCRFVDDL